MYECCSTHLTHLLVFEWQCRGHEEGDAHESGEDEEADVVVPLALVGVALGVLEDPGVV